MLDRVITAALLIVSVIHLLPIVGLVGGDKLSSLYGVSISDPNLEILMRHRAVLFTIIAALLTYAAFQPKLQPFALLVGFASVLSFFYLAYSVGDFNNSIRKVVIVDVVALVALVIASGAHLYQRLT